MQDITVRNKEIRFRSDRIVVESENRAEKIRFTVTEASSIEGLSGMAFYMQYRNRLGEVGMDNLIKSTEGDNLYLDWLPSASFTKESGVVEVQIIGFTQSLVLTEDLTFQSGKLYFTSEGAYIPVYPATSSESPKVGQSISGSVYENEETLSDHRWSSQKAVLILPEDVFQGGTPVYTETQVKSLITEIATQLALAEDAADTASAAALAAQSYKTDAETARTQAQNRASAAEASKDKAEDWASKFNDSNPSATQPVEDENYSAKKYAYDANVSEAEATEQRLIAEGYAVGKQRGTPVGPLSPYFQNNAKFFYQSVQDTNLMKADKVDQATAGDLAGLDTHGNLTDSGIAASNVVKKTDVVNSTSSDSETLPLSAKMGKQLQTQIDSLGGRGRFLSLWNSIYGLPMTEPESSPYTYRSGDYYIVSKTVETELALADDYSSSATYALGDLVKHNGTLYECTTAIPTAEEWTAAHWTAAADHKPAGTSYTSGVRSTTPETEEVAPGDYYEFDGSVWTLFVNTVTYAQIKGDPHDSAALDAELDKKYEKPSGGIPSTDMSSEVQTSLGKADSALQQHQDISGKFDKSDIVQSIGNQIDKVPSNAAVNSAINAINTRVTNIEETLMGENEVTVQYPSDSTYSSLMPNRVPLRALKYAEVPTIRGKSRAWNQLNLDGYWYALSASTSLISDNYNHGFKAKSKASSEYVQIQKDRNFIIGHTYIYAFDISTTGTPDETSQLVLGTGSLQRVYFTPKEGRNVVKFTMSNSATWVQFQLHFTAVEQTIEATNIILRDLTPIFPEGVPSTIAECVQKCPDLLKWDAYDAGSLVDTVVSGVKAVGVSICPPNLTVGFYVIPNGYIADTDFKTSDAIPVKLGKTYIGGFYDLSDTLQGGVVYTTFANDTDTVPIRQVIDDTITIQSGENYVRIRNYSAQTPFVTSNNCKYQLEEGSTRTTFHPYKSDTLSLSEPVTLRSAGSVAEVLTLETGKKTRPIGNVDLGSLNYTILAAGYNHYFISTTTLDDINPLTMNALASGYVIASSSSYGDMPNCSIRIEANKYITIRNEAYDASIPADIASFKASLSGVMMNYELATPLSDEQVCDPVPYNFLEVEGGGTVETIQTQTPVIDNCLDVTYDIIPQ